MYRMVVSCLVLSIAVVAAACERSAPPANAATVVDSAIPRDEALRRFRVDLPPVESLTGGRRSRDALVRDFMTALEKNDTTALRGMLMTRAEFAWLYYPTNPQGLPPYDLSPSLMWFMLEERSLQGMGHALSERGGHPLHYLGYSCDPGVSKEGDNTVYGPCLLRRIEARDTVSERLFGQIVERGGRFKFVSYANRL